MTHVSYIVSAYDRPKALIGCLAALQNQTAVSFEVIVADNGGLEEHEWIVKSFRDSRFRYVNTAAVKSSPGWDCYWSAEWVVEHEAGGQWLCFPSDDSYYVPVFQAAMVHAAQSNKWDLAYCEMLYDRRLRGRYGVLDVAPVVGRIDKTGFILNRANWIGFPTKPNVYGASCSDGEMIERLVKSGIRHGKVTEVLAVHN